jgi:recombination protein RecR
MNQHLPDPIRGLASLFRELPGVGPKAALRFVFALLRHSPAEATRLAQAITNLHARVKTCDGCGAYTTANPCSICSAPNRTHDTLCVVAESRDIATIEATAEYSGRYFVLGGLLSPIEGSTPDMLRTNKLIAHLQTQSHIKEVVLAVSPDLRGESTILYLAKRLEHLPVKLTKLARGLPLGADIEYADEVTLADALRGRREIETHQRDADQRR